MSLSILVTGCQATAQSTQTMIEAEVKADNANYIQYISVEDIKRETSTLGGVYKKYYTKYVSYETSAGNINIVAQDKVSDEQMLYAYSLLSFYLESLDNIKIAEKLAENNAVLVMPNGADGTSKIPDQALRGQPLYELEVSNIGSVWYINNDYEHRDAAYEEIFHMVHDYGIGTVNNTGVMVDLQKKMYSTTMNALPEKSKWGLEGLWGLGSREWLLELSKEGSLEQEYFASVLDSYYGLWQAFEEPGGMWGLYVAKSREDIKEKDKKGYELITSILPSHQTFMARIDPSFEGTFKMSLDENLPYTFKSQYLRDARLIGTKSSGLLGNDENNILMGNAGDNTFDGQGGNDTVQFSGVSTEYSISSTSDSVVVIDNQGRDGNDLLENIEVLRFTDKDIKIENIK
jgi:hypothetical protein